MQSVSSRFVYTQLNGQRVLFLAIQFSISHVFLHSLNVKQFYLTQREDLINCYDFGLEWTLKRWQWRSTPYSQRFNDLLSNFLMSYQDTRLRSILLVKRFTRFILQPSLPPPPANWAAYNVDKSVNMQFTCVKIYPDY